MSLTTKQHITEAVIRELKLSPDMCSLSHALKTWWFSTRTHSMRLTNAGVMYFDKAGIESYSFDFNRNKTMSWFKALETCSKKIKCPYQIENIRTGAGAIKVYDNKIAMLITLYGDVFGYMDSVRNVN